MWRENVCGSEGGGIIFFVSEIHNKDDEFILDGE